MDDYNNPKVGKTYISPSLSDFTDADKKIRIASKAVETTESYEFAKIKDELVLRVTASGKYHIVAKFIEDSRGVFLLSVNKYTIDTEVPHSGGFTFIGKEIGLLINFIKDIQEKALNSSSSLSYYDEEPVNASLTDSQAKILVKENEDLLNKLLKSEVTSKDIVAVGYRKKQVQTYEKLLNSIEYFNKIKERYKTTNEGLWQKYYEKNPWIFGFGLSYIFLSGLDEKKLEQVVNGYSINNTGKRVDALMKTKGIISNLCFVEIKTHITKLLDNKVYRSGCWAPSKELSGAVSQIQGTVALATENIMGELDLVDEEGNPTGERIFNYQPKSFLVIGSLQEFKTENGVNKDKLRSFELYRKNMISPEIITFDELYERAKFIVHDNENQ